ncbi:type II secretion system protein [Neptunomonas japonica]|uniref:General secretion pathway protein G n=1 Tax=Neptunomonas japonica JAMM 1380 TaxID=1441457 RepID=A0A7R6SXG0_9GAMM|nr:type II secretion system protein [Neptunomonas japonica]BBB31510.1 general secretion pathway protein G [Neptunomonas japonica JAMM 1380]
MANRKRQKGFTLLELVISMLVIVILYGVLSTRLGRVAESAERAAVYGVLGQVRQQLNLRLAKFYIDGSPSKAKALINENPFSWISPPPSQYAGEVNDVAEVLVKGRWYFDTATKQLVYRVKRNNKLKIEGGEQRNLKFVLKLSGNAADTQQKRAVYSIKIQTVRPFVWNI